ncbi:hypothetical protein [Streptomyces tubercidicus]|uniref:hypothetical protein n=1 Tax=Streptomyces tubercidicus TaxID=47759 RepID=UPI00378F3CCA
MAKARHRSAQQLPRLSCAFAPLYATYERLLFNDLPGLTERTYPCHTSQHPRRLLRQLGDPALINLGHAIPPVNSVRAAIARPDMDSSPHPPRAGAGRANVRRALAGTPKETVR